MSTIEQLKENVAASLENSGVLARIRAELRAEVFAVIEMQKPAHSDIPGKVQEFARSEFGSHSIDLVVEFLQFFGLKHTLSVFKAETNRNDASINRDALWNAVSSNTSEFSFRKPLLVSLLEQCKRNPLSDRLRADKDLFTEGAPGSSSEQKIRTAPKAALATAILSESQNHQGSVLGSLTETRKIPTLSTNLAPTRNREAELRKMLEVPIQRPESESNQAQNVNREIMQSSVHPEPRSDVVNAAKTAPELERSSVKVEVPMPESVPRVPTVSVVNTVNDPKKSDPMSEQLHQIDDLLKQLDNKQKLTDIARAQFTADSKHLIEDLSDNDNVEFDDDDFEYEPDEVVKDDTSELFPGFGAKLIPEPRLDSIECFSDDPSADEGALDAFDVVQEIRLLSQRGV